MKIIFSLYFCVISVCLYANNPYNPIIKHVYTCDPSTIIDNDTLYIVSGVEKTDKPYNWPFIIDSWHIFSTSDLKTFKDHGPVLSSKDFKWMPAHTCWASQIVKKDNKYYWYVCCFGKIGVAVADNIYGPYTDVLGRPMVDRTMPGFDYNNIDPTVFIDDDGSAYMYWGGHGKLIGGKLKDNMVEFEGTPKEYTGLSGYEEAPWLFKKGNIYYLAYSASNGYNRGPIRYAMSSSPLGPWIDMDDILGPVYNCFSNHCAITEYKGEWYIVYHNGALPGGGDYNRSVCLDKVDFNDDGTIRFTEQTTSGPLGINECNNWGPHVYAGVDASCLITEGVVLNSRIVDDGRTKRDFSWKWQVIEGPGDINVEINGIKDHKLMFSDPGYYKLRLTATDGYAENSDEVNVNVYSFPDNIIQDIKMGSSFNVPKGGKYTISFVYNSLQNVSSVLKINDKYSYSLELKRTQFGYTPSTAIKSIEINLDEGDNILNIDNIDPKIVSRIMLSK